MRQTDATLVKAINQLCDGCPDEETEQFLKSLSRPLQEDLNVCRLFGTKFDAAYINQVYLDAAPGDPVTFRAHDEG